MAPSHRAKRRKSVPSARERAAFGAAADKKKKKTKRGKKRSLDGVEAPLKPTDVEAAHDRREQARALQDMASHAATASQLDHAACHLERYHSEAQEVVPQQRSSRSSSHSHITVTAITVTAITVGHMGNGHMGI